jgi:hypothetical protein
VPASLPAVLRRLAEALLAVSARLAPAQAASYASQATDLLLTASGPTPSPGFDPLAEGLRVLRGRSDADGARATLALIVACLPPGRRDLQVVAGRLSTADLVALLRHPLAAGPAQRAVLDVLGQRTRRSFRNTWHFLDWARSNGLEFAAPATPAG